MTIEKYLEDKDRFTQIVVKHLYRKQGKTVEEIDTIYKHVSRRTAGGNRKFKNVREFDSKRDLNIKNGGFK